MRVAIAHDFLRHGGAERVLEELHRLWPDAPVHTLLSENRPEYADWDVRTSWLQRFVPAKRYRWPLLLYPRMVDRLSIDPGIDLLVTSSVSWMKSLRAPEGVPHLCYLYRPMMFAYERQDAFLAGYPRVARPLLRRLVKRIRAWDLEHADAPTRYLTLSRYIADQVARIYGREAVVIPPPVDIEPFLAAAAAREGAGAGGGSEGSYFLSASRLESYKRVDVVVEACTALGLPVKIAGAGPELARLSRMAGPTVEFLGFVPREELPSLMAHASALLFPAEEDFGIAPVEAMAAGCPVLAYDAGGCRETVEPGVSGILFPEQSSASLIEALQACESTTWDAARMQERARRYAPAEFRRRILEQAEELVDGG